MVNKIDHKGNKGQKFAPLPLYLVGSVSLASSHQPAHITYFVSSASPDSQGLILEQGDVALAKISI